MLRSQPRLPFEPTDPGPRAAMPPKPFMVIDVPVRPAAGGVERICLRRRFWQPRPQLGWLTLSPVAVNSATRRRMVHLTWRAGYGGFVSFSLYGVFANSHADLLTWRDREIRRNGASGLEVFRDRLDLNAIAEARFARDAHCQHLALIVGELVHDPEIAEDLKAWLASFAQQGPLGPRRWRSVGLTPGGWPLALAVRGLAVTTGDLELRRWAWPAETSGRGIYRRQTFRGRTPLPGQGPEAGEKPAGPAEAPEADPPPGASVAAHEGVPGFLRVVDPP